jgi:hypothetical protein
MNGRFQMQGGKNWFLPKEMNANRFFWDSHWLEIWSNQFYPSMGPNGGSVAMDSVEVYMCCIFDAHCRKAWSIFSQSCCRVFHPPHYRVFQLQNTGIFYNVNGKKHVVE